MLPGGKVTGDYMPQRQYDEPPDYAELAPYAPDEAAWHYAAYTLSTLDWLWHWGKAYQVAYPSATIRARVAYAEDQ